MDESSIPPASTIPPNEINALGKVGTAQSVPIRANPCGVGQREGKARYVLVTKPEEIEAIEHCNRTGALNYPRGGFYNGAWWAYPEDMKAWRARVATTASEVQR